MSLGLGAFPFLGPRHHRAQASPDLLDLRILGGATELGETRRPGATFGDPFLREDAIANLGEQLPHLLAHRGTDDALAARQIAVLGRVADRMPHEAEAAAINE